MERIDVNISLKDLYRTKAIPALFEMVGVENMYAIPRISKVVVNVGMGKFLKEDSKVDEILKSLAEITGQKPVTTKAKKAIAGFKIRDGLAVGAMVTLRGKRMWDFLDRLVKAAFPRIRDFQGLPTSIVDLQGDINVGIREHSVFPEIVPEKIQTPFGLQVTVVTTANNQSSGLLLARLLGFPLREN